MVLEISLSNEQMEKYKSIYQQIIVSMTKYIFNSKINSLVIGISGGLDSAVNTIICNEVCKQLGIPLYGYFIQIESNKPEEKERANLIGKHYCNEYKEVDLTKEYIILRDAMESSIINKYETDFQKKIRFGNIKARMRMIFLYNVSQAYKGIVLDNDNKTERNLGFWTLNGDVGDITPLASLWKTEVYELMQYIKEAVCTTEEEKNIIQI